MEVGDDYGAETSRVAYEAMPEMRSGGVRVGRPEAVGRGTERGVAERGDHVSAASDGRDDWEMELEEETPITVPEAVRATSLVGAAVQEGIDREDLDMVVAAAVPLDMAEATTSREVMRVTHAVRRLYTAGLGSGGRTRRARQERRIGVPKIGGGRIRYMTNAIMGWTRRVWIAAWEMARDWRQGVTQLTFASWAGARRRRPRRGGEEEPTDRPPDRVRD